jgi:AcrR family transcriptional regulator
MVISRFRWFCILPDSTWVVAMAVGEETMSDSGKKRPRLHFSAQSASRPKPDRTRARILDAAVSVIARKGIGAATAQEIAREAGIANGTFYLYFKDGDDAKLAASLESIIEVLNCVGTTLCHVDSMDVRVGWTARCIVEMAYRDEALGWALYHAIWILGEVRERAGDHLRDDLLRGKEQGLFVPEIDNGLVAIISAMVAAAIAARLRGEVDERAGPQLAELILTMLGVPRARVLEIANGPMDLTPPV